MQASNIYKNTIFEQEEEISVELISLDNKSSSNFSRDKEIIQVA